MSGNKKCSCTNANLFFHLIRYLISLSKESSTTTVSTGVTCAVKVNLSIVPRLSVLPVLELQIVVQNGSRLTAIHICLWDLRIKVMELPPPRPILLIQQSVTKQFYVTCRTS
jgi:hypothetical protein